MTKILIKLISLSLFVSFSSLLNAQIVIEKDVKETSDKNETSETIMIMEAYGSGSSVSEKYKKLNPPVNILRTFNTISPKSAPTHWDLVYEKGNKENLEYHASFGTSEKDDGIVVIDAAGNWTETKFFDEPWRFPAQAWSQVKKTIVKLKIEVIFDEYITIKKPDGIYCMYRCVRTDHVIMKIEFNEAGKEIKMQEIFNIK
ncbi:MAG: hypothetical protein HRT71_03615 [Flavobacteriales bacterium]|nr:hypothetical protein [Flavobacteriales bacterium]